MKCTILPALVSALLLSAIGAHAQGWAWAKNVSGGTDAYAGRVTTDGIGNAIVVTNRFLDKYSPSGTLIWHKDATNGFAVSPADACTDATGNIYVTGTYSATVTLGTTTLPGFGMDDVFVAKYAPDGSLVWAKNAGTSGPEQATSIAVDAGGNVYIGGNFSDNIAFGTDILSNAGGNGFLAKYNALGVPQWGRKIANDNTTGAESNLASIAVDNSGNILVAGGFTGSSVNFGTTLFSSAAFMYGDIYIAKYNATGDALWAKGGGSSYYDGVADIAVDAAGNCFVTGYFAGSSMDVGSLSVANGGGGGVDAFVLSLTEAGTLRWLEGFGNSGTINASSVAVDATGNVYVGGSFNGASLVFGPTTVTNTGASSWDMMIGRFSSVGTKEWVTKLGGSGDETTTGLAIDGSGNLVVEGDFNTNTLTIGSSTIAWTGAGFRDVLVAKYNGTTGLAEHTPRQMAVALYPNPAENEIVVKAGDLIKELRISDVCGRVVHEEVGNKNEIHVNISKLPAGVYNVVVNGGAVQRFVKH